MQQQATSDELICDVLVAGSGAGGFAAALTARAAGLDVVMVEKEPLFGGTTAFRRASCGSRPTITKLPQALTTRRLPHSTISRTMSAIG